MAYDIPVAKVLKNHAKLVERSDNAITIAAGFSRAPFHEGSCMPGTTIGSACAAARIWQVLRVKFIVS